MATATAGRFMPGDSARQGSIRMKQIAAENEIEIKVLVAGFIEDLGRPATPADKLAAELIAATAVRARRKRSNGRDDSKERRELIALMRQWPPSSQPRATEQRCERPAEHPAEQ
jgi:hypothetical protein